MRSRLIKASAVAIGIIAVAMAGYIMFNRIGLVDSLDFGAGAYYYADIPEFEKIEKNAEFTAKVPVWIHMCLFFAWGFLMYRLWLRIDRK